MPEGFLPRRDFPGSQTITTFSDQCAAGGTIAASGLLTLSAAVAVAKRVFYFPISLTSPMPVAEFIWSNGGVQAGHIQMGVYDESFKLLGANGTATNQGTINTFQTVAPATAFSLRAPARYYLAITSDDATSTFSANTTVSIATGTMGGLGAMTETTSVFGLTDPGIPAVAASELLFMCGISGSTGV